VSEFRAQIVLDRRSSLFKAPMSL